MSRAEGKATREVLAFLAALLQDEAGSPTLIGSDLGNGTEIRWTAARKRAGLVLAKELRARAERGR